MLNTYYLRTIPTDYDNMLALGVLLGAIKISEDDTITAPGGCWDYIGPIYTPTGATIQTDFGPQPVMTPRKDVLGNEYIHVNLATPVNLRDAANALAKTKPEIAAGLASLGKYFLIDAKGDAIPPALPHRVFAS